MANRKITELPAATVPITTGVKFEAVQNGVNVQVDADDMPGSGGAGSWGSITGTLSNQTDLQTALDARQALVNAAGALTDTSTIDLTGIKHTLASSASTRTFTISYTGDDITLLVTLSATDAVYTFPAGSLTVSEGVASGDNTCTISGVSGDKFMFAIKKMGSVWYVVAKNFGQ